MERVVVKKRSFLTTNPKRTLSRYALLSEAVRHALMHSVTITNCLNYLTYNDKTIVPNKTTLKQNTLKCHFKYPATYPVQRARKLLSQTMSSQRHMFVAITRVSRRVVALRKNYSRALG